MARRVPQRDRTLCALMLTVISLMIASATPAPCQTYHIIHTFTGANDGGIPEAGLTADGHGNFYGTTSYGGAHGYGTVFRMTLHGSSWLLSPLYSFTGGTDGSDPETRVVFGPDGSLYGTTNVGTVYNLRPAATRQPSALVGWTARTLYQFQGLADGAFPYGDLIFDQSGNVYGGVLLGGLGCYEGCGSVYELTPSGGGGWTKTVVYAFQGGNDGESPVGIVFDQSGNIIGAAYQGGQYGYGTIFELTPSSGGWEETTLYSFNYSGTGGYLPEAGLIEDAAGNFYGSTSDGPGGSGAIFKLSPAVGGGWTYTVLYNLPSGYEGGPKAPLTMDAAGNLYGTIDGYCQDCLGGIFKLRAGQGGWTFTSLHDFTGGSDGAHPHSNVSIDAIGNLFGTASTGGAGCNGGGCGVVWEITP